MAFQQRDLHHRRAPGNTCLIGAEGDGFLGDSPARNNSKGCGAVMRMAPAGLFVASIGRGLMPTPLSNSGPTWSAITHGHPTGALAGGAFAVLILELAKSATLTEALASTQRSLVERPHHEETLMALESARLLADRDVDHPSAIRQLGQGWVAEEASRSPSTARSSPTTSSMESCSR